MKPITLAGIVLVVLSALTLAYQGITYTRTKPIVDIGPIHATVDTQEHFSIPPILGGLGLAGGIILLVIGEKVGLKHASS
jgi:hypothetical protein